MSEKSIVHYAAKYAVDAMIIIGAVCLAMVPYTEKIIAMLGYTFPDKSIALKFMAVLSLSGLCAEYILLNLRRMYKTLLGNNPFTAENAESLKKCAVSCVLIAVLYAIKLTFMCTPATVVIIVIFGVGALFCLTLKDIFKQASEIKEENELTI